MTKTHGRHVRAGAIEFEPLDTNNKKTAKGRSSEFWSHLFPTVAEKGSKYHQRQQHKTSHPLHPCFSAVTGPAAVAERAIMCCYSRDATQCSLLQWDHGFSCISIPKCTGILKSKSPRTWLFLGVLLAGYFISPVPCGGPQLYRPTPVGREGRVQSEELQQPNSSARETDFREDMNMQV